MKWPKGITIPEILVLIAIFGTLIGLFLPAVNAARTAAKNASREPIPYEVRVFRPDGQIHQSFIVQRHFKPKVSIKEGCLMVDTDTLADPQAEPYIAPAGWQIEVRAPTESSND